jgi:hypothetical protein
MILELTAEEGAEDGRRFPILPAAVAGAESSASPCMS